MIRTLHLRLTHKYISAYSHLDESKYIGDFVVTEHNIIGDDYGESYESEYEIITYSTAPTLEIKKALEDTFTNSGCTHEHDCCGCVSEIAKEVTVLSSFGKPRFRTIWQVKTYSYRNI